MTVYTTGTVASTLGFSRETVRLWADEFTRHLSNTASPGNKRHKQFTDNDFKILNFVAVAKRNGRTYREIHEALEGHSVDELPDVSQLVIPNQTVAVTILERRVSELEFDIQTITAERDEARERLLPLERENSANKALREQSDKRVQEMAAQVERLNLEVSRLNRELGKLEARLETADDSD